MYRLYFLTGVGNKIKIIDLAKVSSALGATVCLALTGIHTFSGCDSKSAFYGKGKRKAFSVACEKEEYLNAFTNLCSSFKMDQSSQLLTYFANMCATCMASHLPKM